MFNTFVQSVAVCTVALLCPSFGEDEAKLLPNEITVTWKGDGRLQATRDKQGQMVIRCECRGDIRVNSKQFDARAKQLTYDSGKQTLVLDGDVKMELHESKEQPATGQLHAERVVLRLADDQLQIESTGTSVQGVVRFQMRDD